MKLINLKACFIGMLVFSSAGMADTFAVKGGLIFDASSGVLKIQTVDGSELTEECLDAMFPVEMLDEENDPVSSLGTDNGELEQIIIPAEIVLSKGLAILSTGGGVFDTYDIKACLKKTKHHCKTEIDLKEGEIHLCLKADGEAHELDMYRRGRSDNWEVIFNPIVVDKNIGIASAEDDDGSDKKSKKSKKDKKSRK